MRILFVEQLGKNNWEYIYSAAKYMSKNHDITCYMSDSTPKNTGDYDFKIVYGFHGAYEGNFANKAKNYLKALVELKKFIKENKFDIIHFEWFSLPWIEWMYLKSLKKYAKIVVTVNDIIPFETRPLEMKSLSLIYKAADAILLHTTESMELFNQTFSTSAYKSVITAAFRDKSDYKKVDKIEARSKLAIPREKTVVLYFGTIRQSKGLDLLIKAFPKAVAKNRDLFLLGAGAFHAVDKEYYENLVKDNLNPEISKIDFKHIPDDMMKYYFSAADILCVPYREIYQSGIAQFGLIYDMPIIGSDLKRMSDMVQSGVNGETFPNEDIEALADVIVSLSSDSEKMKKYAEGSREISIRDFSVEERAKRTIAAYEVIEMSKTH
ncbi:MAG: glycosyltransferase family 4 protein [Lachnospiraceae bacterium]|nr:glycosyltransferase family 4 protein [Lachnospiraceae bacterium]